MENRCAKPILIEADNAPTIVIFYFQEFYPISRHAFGLRAEDGVLFLAHALRKLRLELPVLKEHISQREFELLADVCAQCQDLDRLGDYCADDDSGRSQDPAEGNADPRLAFKIVFAYPMPGQRHFLVRLLNVDREGHELSSIQLFAAEWVKVLQYANTRVCKKIIPANILCHIRGAGIDFDDTVWYRR